MPPEPQIDDITPLPSWPPTSPEDRLMVLEAVYPPQRHRVLDLLEATGALPLDELAMRANLTTRSLCHHLRELYRVGLVAPLAERRDDQGRAWWQAARERLCWQVADHAPGSAGRDQAQAAMRAAVRHQTRSLQDFLATEPQDSVWRASTTLTDRLLMASPNEMRELAVLLQRTVDEWTGNLPAARGGVDSDRVTDDGVARRPIRVTAWVHPID